VSPYGYFPPYAQAPRPASPAGSATVLTFGILAVVLGSIVLLSDVVEIVRQTMVLRGAVTATSLGPVWDELAAEQRAMAPGLLLRAVLMLAMSGALLALGIGLLRRREWARQASIVWSSVAFGVLALRVVLWEVVIQPHMDRMMQIMADSLRGAGLPSLSGFVGSLAGSGRPAEYASTLVLAAFPVVMLVMMTRPAVKACLALSRATP
jgi:hypothetical protein